MESWGEGVCGDALGLRNPVCAGSSQQSPFSGAARLSFWDLQWAEPLLGYCVTLAFLSGP